MIRIRLKVSRRRHTKPGSKRIIEKFDAVLCYAFKTPIRVISYGNFIGKFFLRLIDVGLTFLDLKCCTMFSDNTREIFTIKDACIGEL